MPVIDPTAAHRSSRSESLVWAIEQSSALEWRADVELPRSHWLCHPVPDLVPLTLLAESFRQAGLAICVAGLGMGQSVHFIVSKMTVHVDSGPLRFPRFGALGGTLGVTFSQVKYRKGVPHILDVDYVLPGLASGRVEAQVLDDRAYRAIRRNARTLTDEPGIRSPELIEARERTGAQLRARLGVNEADPFFFDHPVDHIPGMLLLHTAAVMHEREQHTPPDSITIEFPSFGELGAEIDIASTFEAGRTETTFSQGERLIAAATTGGPEAAQPEAQAPGDE